jgi:hypothetical protein
MASLHEMPNDDDHRKIRLKPKAGLLNIAYPS